MRIVHGTGDAYNKGCRCKTCAIAHRKRCADGRARRYKLRELIDGRWVTTASWIKHGTENAYGNYGCRCAKCRAAHSVVMQARQQARKR